MSKMVVRRIPFQSKSNPANSYEVLAYDNGELSCNCPGWTRRVVNGVRECKHTQLVEGMGIDAQAEPATTAPVAVAAPRVKKGGRRFDLDA